jgi:hypothetical protein
MEHAVRILDPFGHSSSGSASNGFDRASSRYRGMVSILLIEEVGNATAPGLPTMPI